MNIWPAFLICLLGILVFILHSYSRQGPRLTFNFFFFAFLVAIIKEGPMRINGLLMKNPSMPYEFLIKGVPVVASTTLVILGWVFTFYLGWYIGGRVSERLGAWQKRIFPTLLLSGLVTASIGYCVEATAMGLGWWHWTIEDARLAPLLVGAPFIVFETWVHFPTQYLLMPYSLIECSRFKRMSWKGIFFVIPFIHSLSTQARLESVRIGVEHAALMVLLVLAFTNPLRFDYSGIKKHEGVSFLKPKLLDQLPMAVMIMLLSTLALLDVAKIHDAGLVISILPAMFFILLAIKRIPFYWIASLALLCFLILQKQAIIATAPVAIVLIFKSAMKITSNLKGEC